MLMRTIPLVIAATLLGACSTTPTSSTQSRYYSYGGEATAPVSVKGPASVGGAKAGYSYSYGGEATAPVSVTAPAGAKRTQAGYSYSYGGESTAPVSVR
jgi:hypothetical protein